MKIIAFLSLVATLSGIAIQAANDDSGSCRSREADEHQHALILAGESDKNFLRKLDKADELFDEAETSRSATKGPKSCKENDGSSTKTPKKGVKGDSSQETSSSSKSPKSALCPSTKERESLCFSGNFSWVTQQCRAANATCCGTRACSGFNFATVCAGSCQGTVACSSLPPGTFIDDGSCLEVTACQSLGSPTSTTVRVGKGACVGRNACSRVGVGGASSVMIGDGACQNGSACRTLAGKSMGNVVVGKGSCTTPFACDSLGISFPGDVVVGDFACTNDTVAPPCCGQVGTTDCVTTAPACSNASFVPAFAQACD